MWMIIYTLVFCAFFDFCYSVSVFFFYSVDCTPQRIPWWLDSTFKLLDRFIAYYIWLYPLLWLFWPTIKRHDEQKQYERSVKWLLAGSEVSSKTQKIMSSDGTDQLLNSKDKVYLETPNIELDSDSDLDNYSDGSDDDNKN